MRISKDLIPPGGWTYQEGTFWISGSNANELIANLGAHRRENGKEEGDPWADIVKQKCQSHPEICLDKPSPMNQALERAKAFLQSLKNYVLTGGKLVDQDQANQRAQTCASCHNNVPAELARPSSGGCGSCVKLVEDATISASKVLILQGRKTPYEGALKACGLCGCDLKLSVWFPTVVLGMNKENANAYPEFCWRKKISL